MSPTTSHIEALQTIARELDALFTDQTTSQVEAFFALLAITSKEEKDVRQEELAFKLKRAQGTIAKQLNRFVVAGILEKNISADSEREKTYKLTRDGKRLMDRIETIMKG